MTIHASCHCGATKIEVAAPPETLTECNCTFCSKRGALWAYYDPSQVTIVSDAKVGTYQREGSPVAHHHCLACGCGTWTSSPVWESHQPTDRTRISVNARFFDDVEIAPIAIVKVDGRNLW